MNHYRIVQSKQNARLKELRQAMARPGRNERGLVAIEGPNLLHEALRAGLQIDTIFVAEGSEPLADAFELSDTAECLLLPRELLSSALATEAPQPIAALIQPPQWEWTELLRAPADSSAPLLVLLAGLQDPGNVGTILRSAEAFGASGVIALPGTVSAWNQKAVRASAGSVFRMPLLSMSAGELFPLLRAAGVRVFTTALEGATTASEAPLSASTAIVIGNEGNGVPAEIAKLADAAITIPCPGPVESLNASIAASILLYQTATLRAEHAAQHSGPARRSKR